MRKSQYIQEIAALRIKINRLKEKYGEKSDTCKKLSGNLKRYENHNMPGDTTYNKERKKLRDDEDIRSGKFVSKRDAIGPPIGHDGHRVSFEISDTIHHPIHGCFKCNSTDLTHVTHTSKCELDFEGNTRTLSHVNHVGYSMVCERGHVSEPKFPGIPYTAFGPELLKHILVYTTRRATDSDIAYYFSRLYGKIVSHNSIWNARKALSLVLAPIIQYILEEFRKAKFLQIDETTYRYRKKRIYVWVIRCDTATLIVPRLGRGADDIYPYVKDLLDKPVVVDGYSVYPGLFSVIQRCWSHILRDAEDVCINDKKNPLYKELYHKLNVIFRKAKRIAKDTAVYGGAAMHTCNMLADEIRVVAAGYGSLGFAVTLTNAADNLFTFLRYPGMPPTNNNSELDVRDWIIPQRNIRRKFMSEIGMAVFAVLQSFAATCDKLNLDIGKSFMKILDDPLYNVFDDTDAVRAKGGLSDVPRLPPALPAPHTAHMLPKTPIIPALPPAPKPMQHTGIISIPPSHDAMPTLPTPSNTSLNIRDTAHIQIQTPCNMSADASGYRTCHTAFPSTDHAPNDTMIRLYLACFMPCVTKSDFIVSYHMHAQVIPCRYCNYYLPFHSKPPPLV